MQVLGSKKKNVGLRSQIELTYLDPATKSKAKIQIFTNFLTKFYKLYKF